MARTVAKFLLILTVAIIATNPISRAAQAGNRECDNCIADLSGRVVYERPDGIYWHELGADRSRLLHAKARWPRWSPDGQAVAFIVGKRIMLKRIGGGKARQLARADDPHAVAFFPDGERVAYTDGGKVKAVGIDGGKPTTLAKGWRFLEIDVSADGARLAATVKHFGYSVQVFDLARGKERKIAKGCSASFSPDGSLITALRDNHKQLVIRDTVSGAERARVSAPKGLKFDNQTWSNHPDWLVSISEGKIMRVYAHHVPTDQAFPASVDKDCDRPDLYIESARN